MGTRKFLLSATEASELVCAFQNCRNSDTKIRLQAVRLYGEGYPVDQIQDICTCNSRTLLRWCANYRQGGIAALCDQRKGGNRAKLTQENLRKIEQQLHRYTPAQLLGKGHTTGPDEGTYWNVPDLARLLDQEYGVVFQTNGSYYQLLAKCAMTYQRPAKQYKSHSATKLMAFEEALEKKTTGYRAGGTGHGDSCRR